MSNLHSKGRALRWTIGAAALALVGITGVSTSWAVANGEDAADGSFPFAVVLNAPEIPTPDGTTRASACSGVLVSAEWVATAGHCFHDASAARNRVSGAPRFPVTAAVGRTTLSSGDGVELDVVEVRQSPTADFALVRLASPVTDGRPIALSATPPAPGETVRMAGWGSASGLPDLAQRPDRLQTGAWTVTRVTGDTIFATGKSPARNVSACPFDSGAPYFVESADGTAKLVATEVTGPTCPHEGEETTARVDVLIPWIKEQDPTVTVA
jgi:secreted trypsin-like serine protease